MGKLYEELKRRKVFRVAAVYAVVAWLLIQVADTLVPALQLPEWTVSLVTVLFILGFPIAVILAWAYESTPEGIKPDSAVTAREQLSGQKNQTLIYAMFVLLLVAVGFQISDRFILVDAPIIPEPESNGVAQAQPTQLSVNLGDEIAYRAFNGGSHGLAISPDGRQLVFASLIEENGIPERGLIHRGLEQLALTRLPDTTEAHNPFFSPDNDSVGYFTNDGRMMRATLDGRPPIAITGSATEFSNGLWVGTSIYFTGPPQGGLYRVSVEGGPVEEIPIDGQEFSNFARFLNFVEDTGELLVQLGPDSNSDIILLNPNTGESQLVLSDAGLVGYADPGYLLFVRDEALMAARFDARERRLGSAVPVLEGFAWDSSRRRPQISLSASGTLAYVKESTSDLPTTLNAMQIDGTRTFLAELPEGSATVKLSQDRRYAAIGTDLNPYSVYLWDMTLRVPTGLDIQDAKGPSWHPDGNHLIFVRRDEIILLNVNDGSEEVLLSTSSGFDTPSLSSDGETLVFVTSNGDGTRGIYAQLPGEATPRDIIVLDQDAFNPVLSPNGEWLAYNSSTGFENSVYVARFPSGTERRRVSIGSARFPVWRADGRALFFRSRSAPGEPGEMHMVEAETPELESFSAPRTLFKVTERFSRNSEVMGSFSNWGAAYDVSDDGAEFHMIYRPLNQMGDEIVIAQNWLKVVERLLPSDRF